MATLLVRMARLGARGDHGILTCSARISSVGGGADMAAMRGNTPSPKPSGWLKAFEEPTGREPGSTGLSSRECCAPITRHAAMRGALHPSAGR
jgi:hypothetical protein